MIKAIKFKNFKTHKNLTVYLNSFNILVGPNNSGKSTILDALRIFHGAYRFASRMKPKLIQSRNITVNGYSIPESSIPITVKHVHTDYNHEPTTIQYIFKDKKSIFIVFENGKNPILYFEGYTKLVKTAEAFRQEFPINLVVVPTLGPLEEGEEVHREDYVKRWSGSHRAPRLFRNIWFYDQKDFNIFKDILEETWSGVSIQIPEKESVLSDTLNMFCTENRITREIFWAGNGFQIWLQLLTHIVKARKADFIIIDEPEIYLHPDLQRKLVTILRDLKMNVIIATHSVEIINEVEPEEVIVVQKNKSKLRRLNDLVGLQDAVDILGSTQNIHLTRLAKGKKVLFVEGKDSKFLDRIATKIGDTSLFKSGELTVIPIGGFSNWEKISHAQWAFSGVLGEDISIAALFDRDYRTESEVSLFKKKLSEKLVFVHVLKKKEIENYLLVPSALERTIKSQLNIRLAKELISEIPNIDIKKILYTLTDDLKNDVVAQLISKEFYNKKDGIDLATLMASRTKDFEVNWKNLSYRLSVVPAKILFSAINNYIQLHWKISISPLLVLNMMTKQEIEIELKDLIENLREFVLNNSKI